MLHRVLSVLVSAALVITMGAAPATAKSAQPDILWYNATTGEVVAWEMNGAGDVLNSQLLSWRCGTASGCAAAWRPVSTVRGLTWHNAGSGELSVWDEDTNTGEIRGAQRLAWVCHTASGCAVDWTVVAQLDVNHDGVKDLLWRNAKTGELSAWLLGAGGAVLGKHSLPWGCDATCGASWQIVGAGDFDSDGRDDLLWHNPVSGELSAWRLFDGTVTGTLSITPLRCGLGAGRIGCSTFSRVVGTEDFNHDGFYDVVWFNSLTGTVSIWHLDGHGTVTSTKTVNWACDTGHACDSGWIPIGVGNFAD